MEKILRKLSSLVCACKRVSINSVTRAIEKAKKKKKKKLHEIFKRISSFSFEVHVKKIF